MRKTLALVAFSSVFSAVALAADWTGTLVDAACHDKQQPAANQPAPKNDDAACMASSQTTSFALSVAGKMYKFDAAGNATAMTALKSRADRSAAPGKDAPLTGVSAKVEGTESGGTIKVDSINIQ